MSEWNADSVRTRAATLEVVASLLEELAIKRYNGVSTTKKTITGSSEWQNVMSRGSVTVEADEDLLVLSNCNFSGDNVNDTFQFSHAVGATRAAIGYFKRFRIAHASTSGHEQSFTVLSTFTNLSAGTYTVTLDAVNSGAVSGSLYVQIYSIDIFRFKRRAG